MSYTELSTGILSEIAECMKQTDEAQFSDAVELADRAERIFVCGAGRTRLAAAAFVMRLIHMGMTAFLVGDVTTPAIQEGDLLVVCSGSGETKTLSCFADTAVKAGAKILLFTTRETSTLASVCDSKVVLHAKSVKAGGSGKSIQPMSNLFAQALGITLDMLVMELMRKRDIDESLMKAYHANLE